MIEKKYQIYVSSTYSDLKEERTAILGAILEMGHIPAGMEFFPAIDEDQLNYIYKIIDQSDYFVLILGARYGAIDKKSNISYIELEYDYAVKQGKPVIALIHGNPDKIERVKTEKNEELNQKFMAFRKKVMTGRLVNVWENRVELCSKIQYSLIHLFQLFPANGWVRRDKLACSDMLEDNTTGDLEGRKFDDKIEDKEGNKPLFLGKKNKTEYLILKNNKKIMNYILQNNEIVKDLIHKNTQIIESIEEDNNQINVSQNNESCQINKTLHSENGQINKLTTKDKRMHNKIKIFFSYRRDEKDTNIVKKFYSGLCHDFDVWMDETGLILGELYTTKIFQEIYSSDVFVVFLSKKSVSSKWVKREVDFALNTMNDEDNEKELKIIPVLLEDVKMPINLHGIQYLDARKPIEEAIKELSKNIKDNMNE